MTKKVFSLKKFIKWGYEQDFLDKIVSSIQNGWPQECIGLTQEEMAKKLYVTIDEWMEEIK